MKPLERILHVEDDPAIARIAQIALQTVGHFEVLSCRSGGEAITQAPAFRPDMLLIDVMMPDIDGPTTVARLGDTMDLSTRPVVYMTARGDTSDQQRYRGLGASAVIVKPFDPMTLADEMRHIWQTFHER